jgi:hypothetical protein
METDIGNPIEYTPSNNDVIEDSTHINDESLQEPYYQKNDFFSKVDKSTWIIAFAVFLLGFFMGKTMQPVILRYN